MRKLNRIIAVTAITTFLFTGCGETCITGLSKGLSGQETETISEFTLTKIAVRTPNTRNEACYFYKDPVTDIVYMQFKGAYGDGGLVWMPDPDTGLPLKYDRFLELYEEFVQAEE